MAIIPDIAIANEVDRIAVDVLYLRVGDEHEGFAPEGKQFAEREALSGIGIDDCIAGLQFDIEQLFRCLERHEEAFEAGYWCEDRGTELGEERDEIAFINLHLLCPRRSWLQLRECGCGPAWAW